MASDIEMIVRYIGETSAQGNAPVDSAKEEIEKIDQMLMEAEKLKLRRRLLLQVLDHFNDTTFKRCRSVAEIAGNSADQSEESKQKTLELRAKILKVVAENGPILNRDLINSVGVYDQDETIICIVKQLGIDGLLERDQQMRIVKGPNFSC